MTLLTILPDPRDLLALEPEDLGSIILEIVPGIIQNGMFNHGGLMAQLFHGVGRPTYPRDYEQPVANALAEALSRLASFALLIQDPHQPGRRVSAHSPR